MGPRWCSHRLVSLVASIVCGVTASVTWEGVSARRMARQHLIDPAGVRTPADVAGAMCGAHAQVLSAAELSIGLRIAGATREDVRRALWEDHTLVKTFGPRGTVHLLPADDLPMWTGALSALPSSNPQHPDPVRFTAEQTAEVLAAIDDALAESELTVVELTEAIIDRVGMWAGERTMDAFQDKWPRWRQLTSTAAHRGVLCFGPSRGPMVTYTHPRRWLPGFRPDDPEVALQSLVSRYLYAYGPSTPAYFAKWLNIPLPLAVNLFARAEAVSLESEQAWVNPGDTATPDEGPRGVRLLPYFDAFVVASQPRLRLFAGAAATRALAGGQAGNYPVMLVDGVVGGVWHQRRTGNKLALTVELLRDLTPSQRRALDDQAGLVGAVAKASATLALGAVTVGPHA
jgi:Winged helix DNA-binding domain